MLRTACCLAACLFLTVGLFAQPVPAYPPPSFNEPETIGEVFASSASVRGSVVLVGGGTRLLSGSTVTAGSEPAGVRLTRGGELRVCPETSLGVNAGSSRDLMLSLSAGAVEANYSLNASSDTIVTPDFRIQLVGPGQFHVAVASDFRGNACVKSLAGNTASVMVSELMGNGSYQVKPGEQVYFRNGSVAEATSHSLFECGCPAGPAILQADKSITQPPTPSTSEATQAEAVIPASQPTVAAALPATEPSDVHIQVDAPLVFSARTPEPAPDPAPDSYAIAELKPLAVPAVFADFLASSIAAPPPQPAVAAKPKNRKGFFGRLGSFFVALIKG